ncbi:MAG TPA: single-stranded DNA-binding protein, partial [Thermotoga naphthophila]|nr:single-stranded DNA-binding protein [Thermotoga petrophila]
ANVVRFMDRKPTETVSETEEELEIPEEDFSGDTFSEDEPPF